MNSGIITKIEYRIEGDSVYSNLSFTGFSAKFTSEMKKTRAGFSHNLKVTCRIPKICRETSEILSNLPGKKLALKFKDGNGNFHYAGNQDYPARLVLREIIGGEAGDFNGYELTITQESPSPHTISTV